VREPWFRARADGLGWRPHGAAGWAAVSGAAVLLVLNFARLALSTGSVEELFGVFLPETLGLLLCCFCLCLWTGEALPALSGRVWFKAKRFGWGWTPAAPEGWLVVGLFLAGLLGSTIALVRFRPMPPSPGIVFEHMALAFVMAAALVGICVKTGEKPGWRWG
jgi:hypothetical protein